MFTAGKYGPLERVVGSREGVERLRNPDEAWWCISKKTSPGDLIAIYVARNRLTDLPEDHGGFVSIFEIVGPEPERAAECRSFGVASFSSAAPVAVKIRMVDRFDASLRLAEMKLDKILAGAKFVRRSCQGTYFEAKATAFNRIKKLLVAKRNAAKV